MTWERMQKVCLIMLWWDLPLILVDAYSHTSRGWVHQRHRADSH